MIVVKTTILQAFTANRSKGETITQLLGAPTQLNFADRISHLRNNGVISKDLSNFLNSVRKYGNVAAHEFDILMPTVTIEDLQAKLGILHEHDLVLNKVEAAIRQVAEVKANHSFVDMKKICFDLPSGTKDYATKTVLPPKKTPPTATTTTAPVHEKDAKAKKNPLPQADTAAKKKETVAPNPQPKPVPAAPKPAKTKPAPKPSSPAKPAEKK